MAEFKRIVTMTVEADTLEDSERIIVDTLLAGGAKLEKDHHGKKHEYHNPEKHGAPEGIVCISVVSRKL
jgi:hypothetical protein